MTRPLALVLLVVILALALGAFVHVGFFGLLIIAALLFIFIV